MVACSVAELVVAAGVEEHTAQVVEEAGGESGSDMATAAAAAAGSEWAAAGTPVAV